MVDQFDGSAVTESVITSLAGFAGAGSVVD